MMFLARPSDTIKLLNTCCWGMAPCASPLILLCKFWFSLLSSSRASMSSFFSAEEITVAFAAVPPIDYCMDERSAACFSASAFRSASDFVFISDTSCIFFLTSMRSFSFSFLADVASCLVSVNSFS